MDTPGKSVNRRRARGANLALLCVTAVLMLGLLGISIYTGLQAYVQNEIQKAAITAAMAGASGYYSKVGPGGKPMPDPDNTKKIATDAFQGLVSNSGALKGYGTKLDSVTHNTRNDSVTVKASGAMQTPFLVPVGISRIEVSASGTARALKYLAAGRETPVGIITMMPDGSQRSMQKTLELIFPLVDNPGTDLYIEQTQQVQYAVEACNDTECYDLVRGATPVGSGRKVASPLDGGDLLVGSATIDLAKAGVRKASKLRFTHGNVFVSTFAGNSPAISTYPVAASISEVYIFGFAGAYPNENNCPVPAGFGPM